MTIDIETIVHEGGIMPRYMTHGAACADVAIPEDVTLLPGESVKVDLRISFNIPHGFQIKMYPRSSLLVKYNIMQPTSIIDEDYHGHVHVPLINVGTDEVTLKAGERVAQIEPQEKIYIPDWPTVDNARDQHGFGGTGTC